MREKPSGSEFRGQGGQSGLNLASLDQVFSDVSKLRSLISFSFCLYCSQLLLLSLQLRPELSGDSSGDEKGCSNFWIGNHD